MDKKRIVLYVLLLLFRTKALRRHTEMWDCIEASRARRIASFRRLQSYQRFLFAIFVSVLAVQYSSTVQRSLWMLKGVVSGGTEL